jgi:hypothetical protein
MKVVYFFSRFTIICNCCFLLYIFLARLERSKAVTQGAGTAVRVPYFKDLIITLGVSAIVVNLLMCICYSVLVILGKQKQLPKWLAIVNFLFLILQFLYFFLR